MLITLLLTLGSAVSAGAFISDGAHGDGNEHFFFLPPMVPDPVPGGVFDGDADPVVEICELAGNSCETFTMTTGPGSETVRVVPEDEHYIVNWHTDEFDLDVDKNYRIRVLMQALDSNVEIGFAEVDVVKKAKDLKNVDTEQFIALLKGRTLPIKFRVEEGVITVFEGDVIIEDPSDLEELEKIKVLDGSLIIRNTSIYDLSQLASLNIITGDLIIWNNDNLTDLCGLANLNKIGGAMEIEYNDGLTTMCETEIVPVAKAFRASSFSATPQAASAEDSGFLIGGNLVIKANTSLTSLSGMVDNLTAVTGFVQINNNPLLKSLSPLNNLTSVGRHMFVNDNDSLTNLTGLDNLTSIVDWLTIGYNEALTSLTGLEGLTSVGTDLYIEGCHSLTNLNGLNNITSVGRDLYIGNNANLTSLIGLDSLTSVGGDLAIDYNLSLESPSGLDSLTNITGGLYIFNNAVLVSLNGLENLSYIGDYLIIERNYALPQCFVDDWWINVTIGGTTIDVTPNGGDCLERDVDIYDADDLDILAGVALLKGNLFIYNNDFTNLSGLESLTIIQGDLTIIINNSLTRLDGLENLVSIEGNLDIARNANLTSLSALAKLSNIGGQLSIGKCDSLTSLGGLEGITSLGANLILVENNSLTDLGGLDNLADIGGFLQINYNDALASLSGLDNLATIGGNVEITDNNVLDLCTTTVWLTGIDVTGDITLTPDPGDCLDLVLDAGQLTGANYVLVNGVYYDVLFVEDSGEDLFGGTFEFNSISSAVAASQALLDQVFTGDYDTDPTLTYGIENTDYGIALTPYNDDPAYVYFRGAYNAAAEADDGVKSDIDANRLYENFSTALYANKVWAVWSKSPSW